VFLGIDLGTSSMKFLLMGKDGTIIDTVSETYPVHYYNENWAEQECTHWWEALLSGVKKITSCNGKESVKSIGFSGQMHGLVMVDREGGVLSPVILWCDQRTQSECDYLNGKVGEEILLRECSNIALTGFTAPKILWIQKNKPEIFNQIHKVMLPKDYLAWKLSGVYSTDYSDASGTMLLDIGKKQWSKKMVELCGLREDQLPRLYESFEVTGVVESSLAVELGLGDRVKVVAGAGDQAAGAVGTGAVKEGFGTIALGTSGVVFFPSPKVPAAHRGLHSFADASGKWHQMGVTLSAASSLKWWAEQVQGGADISLLLEEAEKADKHNRLVYLPYLIGERTPHNDPDAQGVFCGMNISQSRGDLTRAVLEGVAFSLRDIYEIMKDSGVELRGAAISGGGSQSRLWLTIIAAVLNIELHVPKTNEGPAFGAAILAAVGAGAFDSVEEACKKLVTYKEVITPERDLFYDGKYQVYSRLYRSLKAEFTALAHLS
jgi:xylulokinase